MNGERPTPKWTRHIMPARAARRHRLRSRTAPLHGVQCRGSSRADAPPSAAAAHRPRAGDGLQSHVVVLSDPHVGLFTRPSRLRHIFATTTALRPNVVLLAGDLVDDDPAFVPKLIEGMRALDASIPLFAVLGNHEMYGAPMEFIGRLRAT